MIYIYISYSFQTLSNEVVKIIHIHAVVFVTFFSRICRNFYQFRCLSIYFSKSYLFGPIPILLQFHPFVFLPISDAQIVLINGANELPTGLSSSAGALPLLQLRCQESLQIFFFLLAQFMKKLLLLNINTGFKSSC